MKAAIYARVSTEEQTRGHSIEGQVAELKTYCEKEGLALSADHVFIAPGESGASVGPTLSRLLQCAESREFEVLAVTNVDRFSRDPRTAFNVLYELEQLGVRFVSTDEQIDYSTEEGQVAAVDKIADAFKERARLRQRTRKGMERAARKGQYTGGVIPYGYRLNKDTKKLEIDEEQAKVVRLIFKLYVEDGLATRKLADHLNALGVPSDSGQPKERWAGAWRYGRINEMLKHTGYYGERYFGHRTREAEDRIKVETPAIISKELFDRAQAKIKANIRFAARNARRKYLLRGIIRCELCGSIFIGTSSKIKRKDGPHMRRYYRCGGRHSDTKSCHSLTLRANEIEHAVWEDIKRFVTQPETALAQLEAIGEPDREDLDVLLAEIEGQLQEKLAAEEKLFRLYATDSKYTQAALDSALETLSDERGYLQNYRQEVVKRQTDDQAFNQQLFDARSILTALQNRIEHPSFEEKRNAVLKLVKQIMVGVIEIGAKRKPKVVVRYRFGEPAPEPVVPYLWLSYEALAHGHGL